jgi:DNA-binding response OmpR family regulator
VPHARIRWNAARILMLTAAGEVGERVEGLDIGADDTSRSPSPSSRWLSYTRRAR